MRLYVINLDRSVDRFSRIVEKFSYLNLDFTRIVAIDAQDLDALQCQAVQVRNIWSQALTLGEIACFLSHGKALQQFLADDAPYGVIFEDDVTLSHDAWKWLNRADWLVELADKAGEVPDIVKLETSGKKVWLGQGLRCGKQDMAAFVQERFPETAPTFSGGSLAKLKSTHIMAAAYLVSRSAAIKILALMQEKSAPFDHFLFNFSLGVAEKFLLYQLDPAIAVQASLPSTLEGERSQDKKQQKEARSFSQTLKREAKRLVYRTRTGFWGFKTNFFTRDQWKRVPFKK